MRKTQAAESLWVKATYFLTREWQYSFSLFLCSLMYTFSPHTKQWSVFILKTFSIIQCGLKKNIMEF